MGRLVLLILPAAFALASAGCEAGESPATSRSGVTADAPEPAHADLACATCHRGNQAEMGEPAVPRSACTGSGCHTDGGPGELTVSTVTFEHRSHGGDSARVAMACAGCHSHDEGDEPISAGTDACTLCHSERLSGAEGGDCRYCHADPDFAGMTSQGVAVPHEGLPWIQGECVRCHYDVAEPSHQVRAATCASCHRDRGRITAAGIGEDLHPEHTGVGCTTCHITGDHRIVAMSSAVNLECADCHQVAHDVEVTASWPEPATCNACHQEAHRDQQKLVLGVLAEMESVPSEKFLDGLTCRSCHVDTGGGIESPSPVVGQGISCTGCHQAEYATVLRWWERGLSQRSRMVGSYVDTAERALGSAAPDSAQALLADARRMMELVSAGGGEHNLPLAHRIFTRAVDRAVEAYRVAGRGVPEAPELGRQPHMGLCSYCHYRIEDQQLRTLTSREEQFHRQALGVDEVRR